MKNKQEEIFLQNTEKVEEKTAQINAFEEYEKNYTATHETTKKQFANIERAKQLAKNIKWHTIEHLPRYLVEFETNFKSRGGKVLWAENVQEAQKFISEIIYQQAAKRILKTHSATLEEIELEDFLAQKQGIELTETSTLHFISKLMGRKQGFQRIQPIADLTKTKINELFFEKLGVNPEASLTQISRWVRANLRPKFSQADMCITGANFMVADTGSVVLVENEGNIRRSISQAKTHIVVAGIEKMIPSMEFLPLFLPLLATYGAGQHLAAHNIILQGAKQPKEVDGTEEMYVILLDNGRSDMIVDENKRSALYCIQCGACQTHCPVFQKMGAISYGTTYTGPIGAVWSEYIEKNKDTRFLNNASTLCGKCTEVCPMKIDIHNMLVENRKKVVETTPNKEQAEKWKYWEQTAANRKWFSYPSFVKKYLSSWYLGNIWAQFPNFGKSFNQFWKNKNK